MLLKLNTFNGIRVSTLENNEKLSANNKIKIIMNIIKVLNSIIIIIIKIIETTKILINLESFA